MTSFIRTPLNKDTSLCLFGVRIREVRLYLKQTVSQFLRDKNIKNLNRNKIKKERKKILKPFTHFLWDSIRQKKKTVNNYWVY